MNEECTEFSEGVELDYSQLSDLFDSGIFSADGNDPTNTKNVTAQQEITIKIGNSTITLPAGTVISKTDGTIMDATQLSASENSTSIVSGLAAGYTVSGGVLQWGLIDFGLSFSPSISIDLYVGDALNNQTLYILRSTSQLSGWTSDGLGSTTCVVTNGICSFTASKASYYATTTYTAPVTAAAAGGSSGGMRLPETEKNTTETNPTVTGNGEVINTDTQTGETGITGGITGAAIGALGKGGITLVIVLVIALIVGSLIVRARKKKLEANKENDSEE